MTKHEGFTPEKWVKTGMRITTRRGVIADIPTPQDGGVFDCEKNLDLLLDAPAMYAELLRLREAARYLISQPDVLNAIRPDWACVECRPASTMLVDGFRCSLHTIKAALSEDSQ